MAIRSRSVAFLRHLAAPSLTTAAAATAAPVVTAAILRRELCLHRDHARVEAKVDETRRLYDRFSKRIFPVVLVVLLIGERNQDISIKELKETVAKLKEEKEKETAASATTNASSSAMPAAASEPGPEPEPTVANGTASCVGS